MIEFEAGWLTRLAAALLGLLMSSPPLYAETPLYDNLGSLHHPITTTSALAQRYFDPGLRLVYAFNHEEAIRAFEEAAKQDRTPPCPTGASDWLSVRTSMRQCPKRTAQGHRSGEKHGNRLAAASPAERAYIDAPDQAVCGRRAAARVSR